MKPLSLTFLFLTCIILIGCIDFNAKGRSEVSESLELNLWNEKNSETDKLQALSVDQNKTEKTPVKNNWIELFNGKDLTGWKEADYAGRGNIKIKNGEIHIENGLVITGVTFTNKVILPKTNYEIEYEAKKINGTDFFGLLTFPVGDSHASLVTGGWGGAVTGISKINSMDAS